MTTQPAPAQPAPAALIQAALAYARWGVLVLPLHSIALGGGCSCGRADCSSPGKHPRLRHGLKEASRDPDEITRWWGQWPTANVGLVTGARSGLVVLDVDDGHGGPASLEEIEARFGARPATPEVRTGGGGLHVYLRHPGGGAPVRNRAGFAKGLDVRGDGGYVVAPPSNHASGACYSWASPAGELAPAKWLLDLLEALDEEKREARAGERAPAPVVPLHRPGDRSEVRREAYARAALERIAAEVSGAAEGSRNATLNREAFSAGQLVGAGLVGQGDAVQVLADAARACGLPRVEAERTIRSGLIAGQDEPAQLPDFADGRKTPPPPPPGVAPSPFGDDDDEPEEGSDGPDQGPPWICAKDVQLCDLLGQGWGAILEANEPPRLFQRDSILIRLAGGDNGQLPRLDQVSQSWLLGRLAHVARWFKWSARGERVSVFPPRDLSAVMIAQPHPTLPVLDSIVGAPVYDGDGVLVRVPGYHERSRLWYHAPKGFELPEVEREPSGEDLAGHAEWILDEVLGEFPFVGEADKAHALAGLLLPFVRRLIRGCTPLHLVEAPVPGSGKTYLTEIANLLIEGSSGQTIRVAAPGKGGEEENAKIIFAKLLRAPAILRLDNLAGGIDSAVLAEVLTSAGEWEARILGQSQTVALPIRCAWWATANNPKLSTEVARRTVRIRLNPKIERPSTRVFRRVDLSAWVLEHRAEILSRLFALVQGWLVRGRPSGGAVLSGFDSWASTLGGILHCAGVEGFLQNQAELYDLADEETASWSAFVLRWRERYGDTWRSVAELYRVADPERDDDGQQRQDEFLRDVLTSRTPRGRQTQMGRALRDIRDRVFGDLVVLGQRDSRSKQWTYRVAPLGAPEGAKELPAQGETAPLF